jgi:hypothetical protein
MTIRLKSFLNQFEEDRSKKKNSPGFPGLPFVMFRVRTEGYQMPSLTPTRILLLPREYV